MKLRLKGNTVRFRTTRSEVSRLVELGRIEETVKFSADDAGAFTFALVLESELSSMKVRYEPSSIILTVPTEEAKTWASSNAVGMYSSVEVATGITLELSLEKDFACLDRSDAENQDAFPNPQLGASC